LFGVCAVARSIEDTVGANFDSVQVIAKTHPRHTCRIAISTADPFQYPGRHYPTACRLKCLNAAGQIGVVVAQLGDVLSLNQKRKAMLVCLDALSGLKQAVLDEPIAGVAYGRPAKPR